MAIGAIVSLLAFPRLDAGAASPATLTPAPLPRVVWFGIAGIACMTVVQAMTFGFLEAAGLARGFERQAINLVLIALGLVNLLPAVQPAAQPDLEEVSR